MNVWYNLQVKKNAKNENRMTPLKMEGRKKLITVIFHAVIFTKCTMLQNATLIIWIYWSVEAAVSTACGSRSAQQWRWRRRAVTNINTDDYYLE